MHRFCCPSRTEAGYCSHRRMEGFAGSLGKKPVPLLAGLPASAPALQPTLTISDMHPPRRSGEPARLCAVPVAPSGLCWAAEPRGWTQRQGMAVVRVAGVDCIGAVGEAPLQS
ncbi:hypothetical protein NDU88_009995 [Pleurodeles waltl]|uniref:Uncharacterized protein n=1 Tax=Pleurodeles waltl TaxID=8319 RepID=A0AAV7S205_PLEWA|nr:hypothetical protein NDU88_009995 [Pleurodeles waltl]